jgi:hypothetical protein
MRTSIVCLACALVACSAPFTEADPSPEDAAPERAQAVQARPDAGAEASDPPPEAGPDVAVHDAGADAERDAPVDATPTIDATPDVIGPTSCAVFNCSTMCGWSHPRCCTGHATVPGESQYTDGVCGCDLSAGLNTDCVAGDEADAGSD